MTSQCNNIVPSPCANTIADPKFLVVPTGGCWARADFAEIINRTVITKSIVAIDCADSCGTSTGLPQLILDASNVVINQGAANDQLTASLDKLVSCIVNNNGVISPTDPIVSAVVFEYNTQTIVATSSPPTSIIPTDFTAKFNVISNNGVLTGVTTYETYLANPSSWYEFVAPDVFDYTKQSYSYRFVSYAGEFYRLLINIRLTPVPVLYPCTIIDTPVEDPDACCETEDCNTINFCNWQVL